LIDTEEWHCVVCVCVWDYLGVRETNLCVDNFLKYCIEHHKSWELNLQYVIISIEDIPLCFNTHNKTDYPVKNTATVRGIGVLVCWWVGGLVWLCVGVLVCWCVGIVRYQ
jgi:hypothetical protein